MANTKKFINLDGLSHFWTKAKEWITSEVAKMATQVKGDLKLSDIKDVTATAEEVNHLSGVTSSVQNQLNSKAPINSPQLTGTPTAPDASVGTSTQQIANTKFVTDSVNGLKTSLSAALKYKGTKQTYEELPSSGNETGDVWNVVQAHDNTPAGTNYAWDGSKWDALGGDIDLTPYVSESDYATDTEIDSACFPTN